MINIFFVWVLFCGRGLLLRMILISIVHVGCRVIFEYRGFEVGWGWVCRVGRVGVF